MSEISSGLVAVAWIAPTSYEWPAHFISTSEIRNGEPLVRLSDAEAIIAQKDAEILEQCRINGMGAEREAALLGKMERQAERIKELESDVDEEAHIRDRMAKLLAETAVALKGPEKALHRHGWQDLPEVAEKQSAALKLARDAIVEIAHVPVGTVTTSYDMRRIALAAIDALNLAAAPTPPVSEDRKDAERYRVLKSGDFYVEQFVSSSYGWKFVPMEELDEAIDAAMQEDKS